MLVPREFEEEFRAEVRAKTAQAIWVLTWIALCLYPPTTLLDLYFAPDRYTELSIVRWGTTGALAVLLVVLHIARKRGLLARHPRVFVWAFILLLCVGLNFLVLAAGGPDTPYYAAYALLLLGVLIALPWSLKEIGFAVTFIVLQFDVAMLLFADTPSTVLFLFANYILVAIIFIGCFWCHTGHRLRIREFLARKEVESEKARSDGLLLNILPNEVADELKMRGKVEARHIHACTIMFTDFVGFTRVAERVSPREVVASLDAAFSRFDEVVSRWGLEKLKTIGDAYMCAAGVLDEQANHLLRCVLAGLELQHILEKTGLCSADGSRWRMRVGIHAGPVVAGVIGKQKFAYDLWGDTVNTASRLEAAGRPRSLNVTTPTFKQVETFFIGVDRGYIPVRGKGPMPMTRVTRLRPEYSADAAGMLPNERLLDLIDEWRPAAAEGSYSSPEPWSAQSEERWTAGLEHLRVLAELTSDDREIPIRLAEPMEFPAGRVLIEQGQSLSVLLLVLEGHVGVRVTRDSVSIDVARLGPGEIVGELSFVSWEPASATVAALDNVVALRFDLDWMESVTAQHPLTGVRLFHSLSLVLAQRVREANARLFAWGAEREAALQAGAGGRSLSAAEVPAALERAVARFGERIAELEAKTAPPDTDVREGVGAACDALVEDATRCCRLDDTHHTGFDSTLTAYVRRETFSVFMRSALIERMYAKPAGAALDHTVAERIHRNEPTGHGALGEDVDAWFLSRDLAAGVRAGIRAVADRATEVVGELRAAGGDERIAIAVLESGKAPAVFDRLGALGKDDGLSVTCLDSDMMALSALGRRAADAGHGDVFSFACAALQDEARTSFRIAPQHLFCCPVYVEAREEGQLVQLLDEVFENLCPGGVLVTGGVDLPPEEAFLAQTLLDWRVARWTVSGWRRAIAQSAFGAEDFEIRAKPGARCFLATLRRRR